jgi:uncharacterized BrkB/YihY/UPF0761 family membrane protein
MNLNQPMTPSKNKYGLVAFLSGLFTLFFGGGSLFAIIIIPITIISAYKSFKTEKSETKQINLARIGIALMVIAVILAFVFKWDGIMWEWILRNYLITS